MNGPFKYLFAAALLLPFAAAADSPGPSAIPYRAYPPSCLSYPLPDVGDVEVQSAAPIVNTVDEQGHIVGIEQPAYFFWRTPCGSGRSALLGLFGRAVMYQGQWPAPLFPGITGTQGAIQNVPIRLAAEPNTAVSSLPANGFAVTVSQLFVFENNPTGPQFDFSKALEITIHGNPPTNVFFSAYDPVQYPTASLPLPITGYLAGNWYDPTHSGEGIQTEIGEFPDAGATMNRFVSVAWSPFDATAMPYWLFGSGTFTAGDRTATFDLSYVTGGGFAGSGSGGAQVARWGSITVAFPDCNTLSFQYQSAVDLPSGVPSGSGSKTWNRLTQINGLTCE
jgi:hypothetical protein